jgi:type VI protein secretion system component VasK
MSAWIQHAVIIGFALVLLAVAVRMSISDKRLNDSIQSLEATLGRAVALLNRMEDGDAAVARNLEASQARADKVMVQGGEPGEAADHGLGSGRNDRA